MRKVILLGGLIAGISLNSMAACNGDARGFNNQSYSSLEEISCTRIVGSYGKVGLSNDASICIQKLTRYKKNKNSKKMYDIYLSGKLNDTLNIDEVRKVSSLDSKLYLGRTSVGRRGISLFQGNKKNEVKMYFLKKSSDLRVTKKGGYASFDIDAIFSCETKTVKMN